MTHKLSPRKAVPGSSRWQVLLSVLFLVGLMTLGSTTQARLKPYNVVSDAGLAEIKPRVLFVLDTSSSMMWKTQETVEQCVWENCEDTGTGVEASRLATAREALQQVVTTVGDAGDFSLMTFGKAEPPTTDPANCSVGGDRFQWAEYYGFFSWEAVNQFGSIPGVWRLCDDQNRGYPYLRWDDLGVLPTGDSYSQEETGSVPSSPIISDDSGDYADSSNGDRKVQWFDSYKGTRFHADATDAAASVGDYNAGTEVDDHDFYYWPYVDGFPGYSAFLAFPGDPFPSKLGVESDGTDAVTLFAPFYLDLSSNPDITAGEEGPADSDAAREGVLAATAPLIEGGVDADGDTPWASAIGTLPADVDDNTLTLQDNSQFSHTSVSSYLTFVHQNSEDTACAPTSVVLITDGKPDSGEGGSTLNERLSALRETLGVKVYVVGFFISGTTEVNDMACAGNGVCSGACSTPCTETSTNGWDTCADPSDPTNNCAYTASSATDLGAVLTDIVADAIELDIGTGQGSRLNDFGDLGATGVDDGEVVQTYLDAYTEWPSWQGHVERDLCTDGGTYCTDPGFDPIDDAEEEFGPCPQSREWDAGTCLASTDYEDRRIYFNDSSNNIHRISESDGTATAEFQSELSSQGLLVSADPAAEADAIAAFILGFNWPAGWKLPGLAASSPTLIRRVPKEQIGEPRVPIRDAHCAGRVFPPAASVPDSLVDFSNETWDDATYPNARISDGTYDEHYQYQEAVLIGDDLGVLHAFQYDSGNEIFGFIPRDLLPTAVDQANNGAATMGQPEDLDDHIYGISATVNQGWVFDDRDADPANHEWINLAVFGLGIGGTELYALDVSHMSPISPDGPFEILWTSEDSTIDTAWNAVLGETWSRPSLAYTVPGDSASTEPSAQLILGSGYGTYGNNFVRANALTGEILESNAVTVPSNRYGDYGTVGDMAVSSHCKSGMWAEVQEVYAADPAGQLFRWDVGEDDADSTAVWAGTASPVTQFPACQGAGDTCTVGSAADEGDIFTFGPAVSANDRIDAAGTGGISAGEDQFLVALVSGSTSDDDIPPNDPSGEFHSSLYLLVDDHSGGSPQAGFSIPGGAPLSDPTDLGANPGYIRLAFTQIERTRTFTPYTGSAQYTETRNFSKQTRPLRSPRIEVTGILDNGEINEDVEVYRVTYTVYEPAADECDDRWYDDSTGTWYFDPGAVFEVTFRITSLDGGGFDFAQGSSAGASGVSFSDLDEGATLESVEQVSTDQACTGSDCGARSRVAAQSPCVPGDDEDVTGPTGDAGFAVPVRTAVINGFSPLE